MDPSKNKLVQIDPEAELRFFSQPDNQSYKTYLTITNVSQGSVAFKVKTTAPRFYVVKPNQGILDKGSKISIDITLITSAENQIDSNKFLVQVAQCELSSSETYQLNTLWDKKGKDQISAYKLKVSIAQNNQNFASAQSFGGQISPNANKPQSEIENLSSFREQMQILISHQELVVSLNKRKLKDKVSHNQMQHLSKTQWQNLFKHQRPKSMNMKELQSNFIPMFNKFNSDDINQSLSQSQSQNMNQENIKKKTEEVNRQLEQIQSDKKRVLGELDGLKRQLLDNDKQQYDWKEVDYKNESRFQIIHLLITAIICLFIGGYLVTRETKDGTQQPIVTGPDL
ncbi:vesicle-associated membrane protein-associated protein a isoform 2 [Stylonychia lemnae]|uniref:Vesicle-associated membrane protein-associated protein a isoform 2 n=1 Tax=Stylonychia lemnae TaxID=5949 RepID=A0A077ZTD6_STYLE|nr:vesicle-associated membrane protein-associated protein a isoform 2 [Stylonychia lemnae]|eukprot:CDW72595.1 vesicle-associated membrane protein-associated protein a isoform 2 [Stylonychia lemnae]